MRLKEKVALITGAGNGIGRGIALSYVSEGARVIATDIDSDGLKETARLAGSQCEIILADASDPAAWDSVTTHVERTYGALDVLVNNATWYVVKPLTEIEYNDWTQTLQCALTSVYLGMKHGIPVMMSGGGGAIINLSSINQIRFNPGHGAYAAAKAGVTALTKQVALEYGSLGIRCNSISPGFIETERTTLQSDEERLLNVECYPVGRHGETQDVARAAVFLGCEESSFITGHDLVVDGGTTLGAIAGYLRPSLRSRWRPDNIHITAIT